MSKSNIILGKGVEDGCEISFFENIIYWLWVHSVKTKALFPWTFAQVLGSTLKYCNLETIVIILASIIDIAIDIAIFQDLYQLLITIMLWPVILLYDGIKYSDKKYCVKKFKYSTILDEEYCILQDRYDGMSEKQLQKYKKTFLVYLFITITAALVSFCLYVTCILPCRSETRTCAGDDNSTYGVAEKVEMNGITHNDKYFLTGVERYKKRIKTEPRL